MHHVPALAAKYVDAQASLWEQMGLYAMLLPDHVPGHARGTRRLRNGTVHATGNAAFNAQVACLAARGVGWGAGAGPRAWCWGATYPCR